MNILPDTHIFIWFIENNPNLPPAAKNVIEDGANTIFLSHASIYEMAIKPSLNKLQLSKPLRLCIADAREHGIHILSISENHLFCCQTIPLIETHKDPFDRLLIATAFSDELTIVTAGNNFKHYQHLAPVIW